MVCYSPATGPTQPETVTLVSQVFGYSNQKLTEGENCPFGNDYSMILWLSVTPWNYDSSRPFSPNKLLDSHLDLEQFQRAVTEFSHHLVWDKLTPTVVSFPGHILAPPNVFACACADVPESK